MESSFVKYSANGNDFIIFDDREGQFSKFDALVGKKLCHRREGVGADGILFLQRPTQNNCDAKMRYLNADGGEVAMCGNGARALGHFIWQLDDFAAKKVLNIQTLNASYLLTKNSNHQILIEMNEVYDGNLYELSDFMNTLKAKNANFINTGVPHCLFEVENVEDSSLMSLAEKIRFDPRFPEGTNVNFYQRGSEKIKMRTYERGVDGETLSCGTGTVALARVLADQGYKVLEYTFETRGGILKVFIDEGKFLLTGDLKKIFTGQIELADYE